MVNYAPLLNAPDIGQSFLQGQQQGRELRMQGQRDNALKALSSNPQDIGAINALMAVDPRTALAYRQDARAQAQEAQQAQRSQAFGQALSGMEGLPEPVRQLAQADPEGAMQLWQVVQTADAAKLKQIDEMRQRNGQLLLALQDVPEAQRAQAAATLAPQYGVTSLDGLDFSNAGIQRSLNEAVGIGKMLELRMGQANKDRDYQLNVAEFQANQQYRGAQLGMEAARLRASQNQGPSTSDQIAMFKFQQEQQQKAAQQATSNRQTFFNAANVLDTTQRALKLTSPGTTGRIGQLGVWTGSTPARDLRAALETIQANLGFDELKKLRDAGGTLGQVTEKEMAFLQSTLANLDQMQSEGALRTALNRVQNSYLNIMSAQYGFDPYSKQGQVWKNTFMREFDKRQGGAPKAAAPAAAQGLDAAMSRHGGQ